MSIVGFDTHVFVKRLTAAGMPERQAEILAEEQSRLIDNELATKRDLREMEYRLTVRLGSIAVAVGGAVVALVKLL